MIEVTCFEAEETKRRSRFGGGDLRDGGIEIMNSVVNMLSLQSQ